MIFPPKLNKIESKIFCINGSLAEKAMASLCFFSMISLLWVLVVMALNCIFFLIKLLNFVLKPFWAPHKHTHISDSYLPPSINFLSLIIFSPSHDIDRVDSCNSHCS